MKVSDLIELLSKAPPTTEVEAWDPESEEYKPVTGVAWETEGQWLIIQTDVP
jgi:hypothetical protein